VICECGADLEAGEAHDLERHAVTASGGIVLPPLSALFGQLEGSNGE
jgi:hypothetical protein